MWKGENAKSIGTRGAPRRRQFHRRGAYMRPLRVKHPIREKAGGSRTAPTIETEKYRTPGNGDPETATDNPLRMSEWMTAPVFLCRGRIYASRVVRGDAGFAGSAGTTPCGCPSLMPQGSVGASPRRNRPYGSNAVRRTVHDLRGVPGEGTRLRVIRRRWGGNTARTTTGGCPYGRGRRAASSPPPQSGCATDPVGAVREPPVFIERIINPRIPQSLRLVGIDLE